MVIVCSLLLGILVFVWCIRRYLAGHRGRASLVLAIGTLAGLVYAVGSFLIGIPNIAFPRQVEASLATIMWAIGPSAFTGLAFRVVFAWTALVALIGTQLLLHLVIKFSQRNRT